MARNVQELQRTPRCSAAADSAQKAACFPRLKSAPSSEESDQS